MEERSNSITIHYTNEKINKALSVPANPGNYTRHFTQTEDFFLQLASEYVIPRFVIHHNIDKKEPDAGYLAGIETLLERLLNLAPDVLSGLTYVFDPEEIFKPCFYKLYKTQGRSFLYLLRLDLG